MTFSSQPGRPGARIRRLLAVFGCAALVAAATIPSAAAADDPTDAGLWYVTKTGVEAAQQRTTGAGITVAVVDGPINPDAPDLAGTNLITYPTAFCDDADGTQHPSTGTGEASEHAVNMVSLIVGTGAGADGQPGVRGVAPGATLRYYAVDYSSEPVSCRADGPAAPGVAGGIDQAVSDGVEIISISQTGAASKPLVDAILRAERAGVIVVAGSRNRGGTELGWPASGNGVVSVESVDVTGQINPEAVTSPLLAVGAPGESIRAALRSLGAWNGYGIGSGSSEATAWTAGVLALVWSAYPDATANQIIQTLLRSTGAGAGQLNRTDTLGYGVVSVSGMLAVDPATYPDVNPLLRDDPTARPAYADIVQPPTSAPAATSAAPTKTAADPGATAAGERSSSTPLLLGGASLLALLLAAGATLALVRSRRRPAHTVTSSNEP